MRKNYIGLFDVIGPLMIGPSSSHTSGAVTIAWMARQIFTGKPVKVEYTLYGSFADTYRGHGTDRALVGGMLGYRSYDKRISESFEKAREAGLSFSFTADRDTVVSHPNTVDILMENAEGHQLRVRGESLGGGRVHITRLNDIDVDFTGEYSTLIIVHRDEPGVLAVITSRLANYQINIAYMKNFREERGSQAITVIESDNFLPEELRAELTSYPSIEYVDMIEL